MSNVVAKDIRKSFDGKTVLAGVDLTLNEGDRLALVGGNGSGKSTLLKILTGNLAADQGKIFDSGESCVLIAQDFSGRDNETPREFLTRRVKGIHGAIRLLDQSGFDLGKNETRLDSTRCGDLSGGEKKKLEIVAGLASGATFVAIDEPENHLDYQTIAWLIEAISKFQGGVVFVSHNQHFVDRLANSILELENGTITVYTMRYDDYLAEKERQIESQARDWIVEGKTIKRLRKTVQMMRNRVIMNSDTAKTYQQTKRRLEELESQHGKRPVSEPNQPKIKMPEIGKKRGKLIAIIDRLSFSYDSNKVFNDASAELRFGEKVVLFGANGSGKSTLIKLMIGKLVAQSGVARLGINLNWQFMTQDHLAGLDRALSVLEVFQDILKWPEPRCRAYLARYGITVDLVTLPLGILSGGQQARFKLALIFAQEPELLILDEPTNHVDPPTWETIVEAMRKYTGTILAVTHDREFIDAIAQKLWIIRDRKIFIEPGNLSEYLKQRDAI